MICRVDVYADSIAVSDVEPRPKLSRKCYDRFGLSHIPEITIQMVLSNDAELFSISLPAEVSSRIPVLAACHDPEANHNNIPNPISFSEDGTAHYRSIEDLARMAAVTFAGSGSVELPCSIWALLATLKVLLEGDSGIAEVFSDACDEEEVPCSAADVLEMAKFLGCGSVADAARSHIRDRQLGPACAAGEAAGGPAQAAIIQRLARLPDAEFTAAPGGPSQQPLLGGLGDALALPPCLKVKWLRADCLAALDVTRPGPAWTTVAWQSLAFCMHATPHLTELRVRLPCDAPAARDTSASTSSAGYGLLPSDATMGASHRGVCGAGPSIDAGASSGSGDVGSRQFQYANTWYSTSSAASPLPAPPLPELSPKLPPTSTQSVTPAPAPAPQYPPPQSTGCRGHVSTAAIDTLSQLPTVLPQLRLLDLHSSQIAPSQTKALARALTLFSDSLQELTLDCWPCAALDAEAAEREFKHAALSKVLLDGVCRLGALRVLSVPDWGVVVGDSVEAVSTQKLAVLGAVERIMVAGFPCATCAGESCRHFLAKLPFKAIR